MATDGMDSNKELEVLAVKVIDIGAEMKLLIDNEIAQQNLKSAAVKTQELIDEAQQALDRLREHQRTRPPEAT